MFSGSTIVSGLESFRVKASRVSHEVEDIIYIYISISIYIDIDIDIDIVDMLGLHFVAFGITLLIHYVLNKASELK